MVIAMQLRGTFFPLPLLGLFLPPPLPPDPPAPPPELEPAAPCPAAAPPAGFPAAEPDGDAAAAPALLGGFFFGVFLPDGAAVAWSSAVVFRGLSGAGGGATSTPNGSCMAIAQPFNNKHTLMTFAQQLRGTSSSNSSKLTSPTITFPNLFWEYFSPLLLLGQLKVSMSRSGKTCSNEICTATALHCLR